MVRRRRILQIEKVLLQKGDTVWKILQTKTYLKKK
jgi:hypothetical protein